MTTDRNFNLAFRRWAGIFAPVGVLLITRLVGDWHDAARTAGGLSVFMIFLGTLLLFKPDNSRLPRASEPANSRLHWVADALLWSALPLGVFVWGIGQPLYVAALATVTPLAFGAAWRYRHDLAVLVSIVLGGMAVWVLVGVGVFGTWPAAAIAASAPGFAAAVAYYVGRVVQDYGWQSPVPFALCLAATPFGLLLWGIGMELRDAGPLAFLVAATGVAIAIAQKDRVNDD